MVQKHKPVSEMIKDRAKRSAREPSLLFFSGILVIGGAYWQLQRIFQLAGFLPIDTFTPLLEQTQAGVTLGILVGMMIFVGSGIMYLVHQKVGGILAIIFSGLALFVPGVGFFIGPLLGILIGVYTLLRTKPPEAVSANEVL